MADAEVAENLYFNGINAATGDYLLQPLSAQIVSNVARGERLDPEDVRELKKHFSDVTSTYLGVIEGIDPADLGQAGWGVVFATDADPAVRDALKPLLEHRRDQASKVSEGRFKVYADVDAYRAGEAGRQFLVRQGAAPGQPANPDVVPYYLLLVGDPEAIPYRVQYQLDVTYGVGRIHFDTPEEYARYAQAVIDAEMGEPRASTATFLGVRNEGDKATTMSADHLVDPLSKKLTERMPLWSVTAKIGEGQANKQDFAGAIGGAQTPTLVFTASHGVGFPNGDPRQLAHQGAPLCQDWPGPDRWRQGLSPDFYFSAEDIGDQANVAGLVAFFFACYGAGTPKIDEFGQQALGQAPEIAPHAFVGKLPQRLLGHPKGGALAVVGHVERAWGYSFMWPRIGEQLDVFLSTLTGVMNGRRLGAAIEYFNDRYAALTTELEDEKDNLQFGGTPDPMGLSGLWTARNDARNYVLLGDPAVRIVTAD
jgi:Peptidase family C25